MVIILSIYIYTYTNIYIYVHIYIIINMDLKMVSEYTHHHFKSGMMMWAAPKTTPILHPHFGSADCAQFGCAKVSWSSRLQSLGDRPKVRSPWWELVRLVHSKPHLYEWWPKTVVKKKKTDPPLNTEMQKHDDPGGVIYLWLTVEDIHPQTFIRCTEDLREKWKKNNQIPRFSTTRYVAVNYSISWLFTGQKGNKVPPFRRATADGSQLLLNADPWRR